MKTITLKWIILLIFSCCYNNICAEYTIEGQVVDADSGEPLISCSIVLEKTKTGVLTDFNGNL